MPEVTKKYLYTRHIESAGGLRTHTGDREQAVVELPAGIAPRPGAIPLPDETPVSEWQPVTDDDAAAPAAPKES